MRNFETIKKILEMKKNTFIILSFFVIIVIIAFYISEDRKKRKENSDSWRIESIKRKETYEKEKREQFVIDSLENEKVKAENVSIIKKLKSHFNFKTDEFTKVIWVEPKTAPKYLNRNHVYCYFAVKDEEAYNLRLKIQYTADNWLFIQKYIFNVDGWSFDYNPSEIKRDNNSTIWEWSDDKVTMFDQSLVDALVIGEKAKIRFVGQQYNKDRDLTQQELLSIQRTIQLYRAMGGRIN